MPLNAANSPRSCPSCGSQDNNHILSGHDKPVSSTVVFETTEEASKILGGDIDLVCCRNCGLIFNRIFDNALARVSASYESSQAGSAHFNAFARGLVNDWVKRYNLEGKRIIEVGSGQGEFIVEMLKAGVSEAVAIDPLATITDIPEDYRSRVQIEANDFLPQHADFKADALVSRHTLEHVGDVSDFLKIAAAWSRANSNGPILLEVPGAERILSEGAFWDIWFEHCNYFTLGSVERAFRLAGMEVTRCELVYDGQYIILEARAALGADVVLTDASGDVALSDKFENTAKVAIASCLERLHDMAKENGPIVIWQAAAKTVGLLSWLGPDAPFTCAVDLNARRHGFFLPPFGMQIRSPADLKEIKPRHVVLMNPVYEKEVSAELTRLGIPDTKLHTIDKLSLPI